MQYNGLHVCHSQFNLLTFYLQTKQQYVQEYIKKYKTIFGNDSAANKFSSGLGVVNSLIIDSAHGYDAMWLAARALNATDNIAQLKHLSREQSRNLTFSMYNHCINDTFQGASVSWSFIIGQSIYA